MTTFKRIHISDAKKALEHYKEKGCPKDGEPFEAVMTQIIINRINNIKDSTTIELNAEQFDSFKKILSS
jgi:hypothetical protein